MKNLLLSLLLIVIWDSLKAQYTIITPGNAQPNINTNSPNSQGVVIPSVSTEQLNQIANPQIGAVVYHTGCSCMRYYNGSQWIQLLGNLTNDDYAPPKPFIGKTLGWDYHSANPGTDEANAIALIYQSNWATVADYYVTGRAWSQSPLGQNDIDGYFLAKYTSTPWERKVGNAVGHDVAVDGDGNVYTTGTFINTANFHGNSLTSNGNTDVFLAKYDSNGNLLWVRNAGGSGADLGRALFIAGSNVYLTGYFSGNNFSLTSPSNSVVLSSTGGKDIFMAKYDLNGNLLWANKAGGQDDDEAYEISGNLSIAGYFMGTAFFGSKIHTSNGGKDIVVLQYDTNGNIINSFTAGGIGDDVAKGITEDNYITGYFSNSLTMPTFNSGSITVNSAGGKDMFLARIDYTFARTLVRGGGVNDDEGVKIRRGGSDNPSSAYALVAVVGNFSDNANFSGPFLVSNTQSGFIATFSMDGHYQWGKALSKTSPSAASDVALIFGTAKPYIVGVYDPYGAIALSTAVSPAYMKLWTTE